MKNVVGRIINGIGVVGSIGAIMLGLAFFILAVIDAGNSLSFRIVIGLLAVVAFLLGFFERDEKEADDSVEDNAN
ncbi:hypothetical protein [Paenibacillus dakarensis]|uniref:hypothetical protein n=1 Tax=Paenibacillus dakarensis TaxID=1527293 RepID=UPI0006D5A63E|nr:hypothetical protein [Paenibacillus dakarensis]